MCSGGKVGSKTWFRFHDAYSLTKNAVWPARRKELQGEGDPKAGQLSSSRDSKKGVEEMIVPVASPLGWLTGISQGIG